MNNASGQTVNGIPANLKVTSLVTASNVTVGNVLTAFQIKPNLLYSVAGTPLPAASAGLNGTRAIVSDATTPTYFGAYVGGGAITCGVLCSFNGTTYSWVTA